MTAVNIRPESVETPAPQVRVALKPFSLHPGMVNGAWWPRSRDLARELPALVAVLDRSWGKSTGSR